MIREKKIEARKTYKLKTSAGVIDVQVIEITNKKNGPVVRWSAKEALGVTMLSAFYEENNCNSNNKKSSTIKNFRQ